MTDEMSDPRQFGPVARRLMAHVQRLAETYPVTDEEPDGPLLRWQEMEWARVIPRRYHAARLEHLDGPAGDLVREWATGRGPRPNLILAGPVGCGKTYAAIAALRPSFERSLSVGFWPAEHLLRQLHGDHSTEVMNAASHVNRLVLDDLGAEYRSDWSSALLGSLIDQRWSERWPIVVTTNAMETVTEFLNPRDRSRLLSDAVVVTMTGADRRLN